ncbi:jg8029 [Pararge aegeria aegeria]|uniref:Jg8029 protein n=1 Tax=Pararge aegeria aegeria TaxID=348720 RepID=A0A8S4RI76_9NEOP|nr:jg8029 [Pararge aegeria aegeria]
MSNERFAKRMFYSELENGKRKQGGQFLRYKANRHLSRCNINITHWESLAGNRTQWRHLVQQSTSYFEDKRRIEHDAYRDHLKARPPSNITYNYVGGTLTYPHCARIFSAKIEYISHIRAHERSPYM